jgi:hypothetical protein
MGKLIGLSIFLLMIVVFGCAGRHEKSEKSEVMESLPDEKVDERFKAILRHPEKFDSVVVELTGIFRYEFENVAIYLTNKDSDSLISSNAFWVNSDSLSVEDLRLANRKRVHLKGRFNKDDRGHMNYYSGTIEEVGNLEIE